ncbi:hypothetical protein [Candidatus Hepatoplasma crinochetorum]|uniref:hypothetical protein n=1 Tax=Candidatus Hepatoplasma crinochetorum TaxID=295596 RepID=UPI00308639C6|nr:MAG: hypothetical protein HCTKY_4720 [Candidatus Hepatoplasma crinochetorum]
MTTIKEKVNTQYQFYKINQKLNLDNLDKLSKLQIKEIQSKFDYDLFESYKKILFRKWKEKNYHNNQVFLSKMKHIIIKLDLKLYNYEDLNLQYMLARDFTNRRFFKTIEAPYPSSYQGISLSKIAYFLYKNVNKYLLDQNEIYQSENKGELIFSNSEIVFYDQKKDKIIEVIKFYEIKKAILYDYGFVILLRGERDICFRYKDNFILFLTLDRLIKKFNLKIKIENRANKVVIL